MPQDSTGSLVVESHIGISFISAEKACEFMESEIPAEDSFGSLLEATKRTWEEEVLSTITTTEASALPYPRLGSSCKRLMGYS
jgi:putative alpha-1,2-mannosidase